MEFQHKPVLLNECIEGLNIKKDGKFSHGEIGLPMTNSKLILPCGIYGRWEE